MKAKVFILVAMSLLGTSMSSEGRVPLMKERVSEYINEMQEYPEIEFEPDYSLIDRSTNRVRSRYRRRRRTKPLHLGVEVGALGQADRSNQGAILGMTLLYGIRAIGYYSLSQRYALKPSLGYFRRKESTGNVAVTQHLISAGLNVLYVPNTGSKMLFTVGLANRFDVQIARIATGQFSGGGTGFQYRLGPAVGAGFPLGKTMKLVTEAELTAALKQNFPIYFGLSVGLLFGR